MFTLTRVGLELQRQKMLIIISCADRLQHARWFLCPGRLVGLVGGLEGVRKHLHHTEVACASRNVQGQDILSHRIWHGQRVNLRRKLTVEARDF